MEIWKDIKGYEGRYQVSDLGRVKSLPRSGNHCTRTEAKLLYLSDRNGYKGIALYMGGKRKMFFVHRLVAEAFIPNEDNTLVINHINGDKTDNRVINLEWVTQRENTKHSFDVLKNYNTDNKIVICVETGKEYKSITEASKVLGISRSYISKCCSDKPHCITAGGYHWRYKEVN